ncbi:hypothetical protein D3C86_1616840 [compost metagenome]
MGNAVSMMFTVHQLAEWLGQPTSAVLSASQLRGRVFERSLEDDLSPPRIFYVFPDMGLDLRSDLEDKIATIFVHFDDQRRFDGDLLEFTASSTRSDVVDRVGAPSKRGGGLKDPILGDFGPWDRFELGPHSLHVEYQPDADRLKLVTLMRADVMP